MSTVAHQDSWIHSRPMSQPFSRHALWIPAVLTVGGGLLRAFFFIISNNAGGDALARAAATQKWMNHHSLFPGSMVWDPLYFWISGPLGYFIGAELGTRLLSLLSGTLTIFIVYKLTERLAGSVAAGISGLVCMLSSLHIGYSTASSSESSYVFFLVLGIWLLFEFQASNRISQLVLGSIALTISAGIRYEAWIFLPLITIIFTGAYASEPARNTKLAKRGVAFLMYVLLAGAWPFTWIIICWLKFGNPLYGISHHYSELPVEFVQFGRSRLYSGLLPIGVLLLALSPIPAIGAAYSALRCWGDKTVRQFLFIVIAFGLFQEMEFVRGGAVALARYMLTSVVLCAVLSGIGLVKFSGIFTASSAARVYKWTAVSLVATLACILVFSESALPFSEKFASVSPRLRYPAAISQVGKFLGPQLHPGDALIVDDYHWDSNIVEHSLGLPLLSDGSVFRASAENRSELGNFIRAKHPRYLIYATQGDFRAYWGIHSDCPARQESHGIILKCEFANDVYRVYELQYPEQ